MRLPKRKSELNRRFDESDAYLTMDKINEIKDEIEKLEKHIRPKVVQDLTAAREMGDLSENAAYSHAKGRLMGIDNRLLSLKEKIKNAIIIERGINNDGVIKIGSFVKVIVNDKEKQLEITGAQEANPSNGKISHKSPVGSALLGRQAGDIVEINIQDRTITYKIINVG